MILFANVRLWGELGKRQFVIGKIVFRNSAAIEPRMGLPMCFCHQSTFEVQKEVLATGDCDGSRIEQARNSQHSSIEICSTKYSERHSSFGIMLDICYVRTNLYCINDADCKQSPVRIS